MRQAMRRSQRLSEKMSQLKKSKETKRMVEEWKLPVLVMEKVFFYLDWKSLRGQLCWSAKGGTRLMGILHFLFHFVISYSNGWKDNLFRVFRVSSFKLSEVTENQTNRQVYNKSGRPPPSHHVLRNIWAAPNANREDWSKDEEEDEFVTEKENVYRFLKNPGYLDPNFGSFF